MKRVLFLTDESSTLKLGERLSHIIPDDFTIYLRGELGAGKTTLVRGFLKGLGHKGAIKSPTFTLLEPYVLNHKTIYHFDLYRVSETAELELIGMRDYFAESAVRFVEWPERAKKYLVEPDWYCEMGTKGEGREIRFMARSQRGKEVLERVERL
jgi:tRNA threonylcarbamoyladenosine biosynthesis protein TsaE